jgi:ribosomal protein L7Ae-like RNA K-turn-binding protein
MDKNKLVQSLGLCQKARKLVSGEQFVLEAIKKEKAKLVFLANDAGINTTKRIKEKTEYHNLKTIVELSSEEISGAIGKRNRKVIAITDAGFARMIESQLNIT